jgi:outer membrane autotransporter protein
MGGRSNRLAVRHRPNLAQFCHHSIGDVVRLVKPRQATASLGGNVFGTLVQAGYNIEHERWRLTPIVGLRCGYGEMASATETGADSVNLAVGDAYCNSLVGHLGSRLAFCVTRRWRAEAYGQWEHEYADASNDMTMAFAGSPGQFTVQSAVAERDAARTGVVAIGEWNSRVSIQLNYDALLRASYVSQQLTGGLSIGF